MANSEPLKYEGKIVKQIIVEGVRGLTQKEILYDLKTTEGYPLKSSEVREDIKKIFEKGKFEKVDVLTEEFQEGVRLKFICKERPLISAIVFKGNNELSETDLSTLIPLKEGDIYRKDYLQRSVRAIRKKYREEGLFNASIKYKVTNIGDREDQIKITFIIDEGEELKVRKISILGLKRLSPRELKMIMETKEYNLWNGGEFKEDLYAQDKAKIIAYCKQYGYLDAQITEDSVEYEWANPEKKKQRGIYITIKVNEGRRYFFNGYSISIQSKDGGGVFKTQEIARDFEQERTGSVFNNTLYEQDRQMISMKYASRGYIFARIIPKRIVTEKDIEIKGKTYKRSYLKIDFEIEEGSQAYIETIIIKGAKKTKEKVIKREILIYEGELFNASKVQLSREKVYNLGFFKQVNIDVRPGSKEGYMNLVVDVEEQPTGTISLGGGYGTTSGFNIFADVAENNLLGYGQRVGVKFEYGPEKVSGTISFNERWLLDKPVGFNTSVFYYLYKIKTNSSLFSQTGSSISTESRYEKQSIGYSFGFSYRFLNFFTAGTNWGHAFSRIIKPSGTSPDEIFFTHRLGLQEKRSLGFFLSFDNKDNYLNPTSGGSFDLNVAFTGGPVLGGGDHHVKIEPEGNLYYSPAHLPYLKSHPVVFELRASGIFIAPPVGSIHKYSSTSWKRYEDMGRSLFQRQYIDLPRNFWLEHEDRLFIGGPETLRGWDYYDKRFPKSWSEVGLFHRILYGMELRIPLHPQMLWFALFFDAGSLWSDPFWEKQMNRENQRTLERDLAMNDTQSFLNYYSNNNSLSSQDSYDTKSIYRLNDFFKINLLGYFRYSYGFGFRVQIPMMPLRFWFGRRMVFSGGRFKSVGGLTFQFAIGDMRF